MVHLNWRGVAPGAGPSIQTSVTDAETAKLAELAKGKQVLEIGSAYGYSACVMALAGAEHVTAVDPHEWIPGSYESMMSVLGFYDLMAKVTVLREQSQTAMPRLMADGRKFGLIFVDGDHGKPAVVHDVLGALDLLEPGGTIACHDMTETCCCPGVAEGLGQVFPGGPVGLIDTMAIYEPAIVTT